MVLQLHGVKVGEVKFLNGERLTIKEIDYQVHKNSFNQEYIYIDTEEKGIVAYPLN